MGDLRFRGGENGSGCFLRRVVAGLLRAAGRLGLAAYITAIVLYVLIGALALVGGLSAERTEALLQTLLVFLGFNVAWLLMFEDRTAPDGMPPAGTE